MGAGLIMVVLGLAFVLVPNMVLMTMPVPGKLAFMGVGAFLAVVGGIMIG